MALTLEQTIERIFRRCNLEGESVDIWKYLYSYKATRDLPEADLEAIYDEVAERLGFFQ